MKTLKVPETYDSSKTLKQYIVKPEWIGLDEEKQPYTVLAKETLEPDIISIEWYNSVCYFMIYDAKYYNMQLEPGILNKQPGIESITKQYLYQLAYKGFIDATGISEVRNCFLLPTYGDSVVNKGVVRLSIFEQFGLKNLGLKPIEVRMLPAKEVYRLYLQGQKYAVKSLDLFDSSSSAMMLTMAQENKVTSIYGEGAAYLENVAQSSKY